MNNKKQKRFHRKLRIRAKITGTSKRPRMTVFRSNTHLSVQLIDDGKGMTLLSHSVNGKTVNAAKELGLTVAQKAKEQGIKTVVFDRNGYQYHGKIRMIADAVREGGLHI